MMIKTKNYNKSDFEAGRQTIIGIKEYYLINDFIKKLEKEYNKYNNIKDIKEKQNNFNSLINKVFVETSNFINDLKEDLS